MRILHTADLHLGQIIYRHYDRADEHDHFFRQLHSIIADHRPDALVVSGDIFDVQQPSASAMSAFTARFVALRRAFPHLHIVIVAGNHDSASRLHSNTQVWGLAGVTLIGAQPPVNFAEVDGWQENYVVRLPQGFIIALPYITGGRPEVAIALQDYVEALNTEGLPVVMTAHMAVSGSDTEGHDPEIGTLYALSLEHLGRGYDYLALGHIHKPQTLGQPRAAVEPSMEASEHPAPVARYSGAPIHISGDEAFPHSVSIVDIDCHGGTVAINRVRINQLRHFVILPEAGLPAFETEKATLKAIEKFIDGHDGVYIRLRVSTTADLSPEFNSKVYTLIESSGKDIRYNPKILWVSPVQDPADASPEEAPRFEVSELQQMDNPLEFIRRTIDRYPTLAGIDLEAAFAEIEAEIRSKSD